MAKITLQQDGCEKLSITLEEGVIVTHAISLFKWQKRAANIQRVTRLGSADYNKLIKFIYNICFRK